MDGGRAPPSSPPPVVAHSALGAQGFITMTRRFTSSATFPAESFAEHQGRQLVRLFAQKS